MTTRLFPTHIAMLLVLASAGVTLLHATLTCPEGQALYGQRCYKVYRPSAKCPTDFNQTAANQFCQANDGVLASIHSQEQQDFITNLIKKDQKAAAKRNKCGCHPQQKDYAYWIGLELSRSANGSVSSASWTDDSPVNYGNPNSASFRPPFVAGAPEGSVGDGNDPSEVCPPGHAKNCVQVIGFGSKSVGGWTDKHCANSHQQNVSCSCDEEQASGNSTAVGHHHSSSSSSSIDEDGVPVDQCQLEAALNGFICQYCPAGWSYFQGHCYITLVGTRTPAQLDAACAALGATLASIHSQAENVFVMNLAADTAPAAITNLIGLRLTYNSQVFNAPVVGAAWTDTSPVNYGNPTAPGFVQGTYPWAPQGEFPPQPDNRPPPGTCVIQWLPNPGAPNEPPGTWDDADCAELTLAAGTCKI